MNKNTIKQMHFFLFVFLIFVSLVAYAETEVSVGTFTVGNAAPNQPENFTVQDGASSYDSYPDYPDTHDVTPYINWSTYDSNFDTVTTHVCVASSSANRDSENCDINYTVTNSTEITALPGLSYAGANVTYYVRLTPDDGTDNGTVLDTQFYLLNSIPTTPISLSPNTTHNQTPGLSWFSSDADDGSVNHWPADTLTHHIRVGITEGDGTYESNDNADNNTELVDTPIPWGITPEGDYANNTVNVSIWATDGISNGSSNYYNTTLTLYDYLHNVTDVEITDAGSTYSSCISSTCAINPVEGQNSSVAVRITSTDTDDDCDGSSNSDAYVYLCLNTTTCTPSLQNFTWQVDSIARAGSVCTYTFSTNKTTLDGTPEFFVLPNASYQFYVNVTSQAGQRINDPEQTDAWTYGTLRAVQYPNNVTLGDGSVDLAQWNNGTDLAVLTNQGNENLNVNWSMTDPDSGSDNWTLNGTDLQIDDDNSYIDEDSGDISPVYMNGTSKVFEPLNGLNICSSQECNDAAINETMNTYYHIAPPLGLLAGIYNSTITITIT